VSKTPSRFETVGDLYYRATGKLRPGKSAPPATGEDTSSDENRERFEAWLASEGFIAALDRIAELEQEIEWLEESDE
jgi:hypothetical protein